VMTRARASGNSPVWPRSLVRKMGEMGGLSGVRISWFAYSHISLELSPSARAGRWDCGERKNESVMCIFVCDVHLRVWRNGGMGVNIESTSAKKVSLARIDRQRVLHGPTAGEAVLDTSICGI
jgi:hypothetical protein